MTSQKRTIERHGVRRTSNFLELPNFRAKVILAEFVRPRVNSLPDAVFNPRHNDELYRLRRFSISKGSIVNCGDSLKSRGSNTSLNSLTNRSRNASAEHSAASSCCFPLSISDNELDQRIAKSYRVLMLGDCGVGKTALVAQFMTSEYINTYDTSLDDEFGEKSVNVLLDDIESELTFIDHGYKEMSVENAFATYEPDACVVVYAVVSRPSFQIATDILDYLWLENFSVKNSVILVGNKSDLERARAISYKEGRKLAVDKDCKFIETSSGLKYNVDELLVGILMQIRLKYLLKDELRRKSISSSVITSSSTYNIKSLNLAKNLFLKHRKTKSCQNLLKL